MLYWITCMTDSLIKLYKTKLFTLLFIIYSMMISELFLFFLLGDGERKEYLGVNLWKECWISSLKTWIKLEITFFQPKGRLKILKK